MSVAPNPRVRTLNQAPLRSDAQYVIYWTGANRRVDYNHALAHAIDLANDLNLPVLYYEPLTYAYPHANDRTFTFILENVPDTVARLEDSGIGYCFSLRKSEQDPPPGIHEIARHAAAIVIDDYPTFYPRLMIQTMPQQMPCAMYAVDASCIVPMSLFQKREYAAYTIRPKIHKLLPTYLQPFEMPKPRRAYELAIPGFHTEVTAENIPALVAAAHIDHSIKPSVTFRGGRKEALRRWQEFLKHRFADYAEGRNEPAQHKTSNMSPYLHFGNISALELALSLNEYAAAHKLDASVYLEELIVRRELAFNFARFTENHESMEVLPEWALKTLAKHDPDPREPLYTPEQMLRAETYDDLWNATQKEMLLRGKIHGYYRMYWGKKVVEWSRTHADALRWLLEVHDKYAIDGRDPNTYTNILWLFGLHDRPWTERPIFGQIRWMSYDGMKRKTDIKAYIREIEYLERTGKDPVPV